MVMATAGLSPCSPAARASHTPGARAPTYNTPEWTPPEASPVEGGLRHSAHITPPPRAAPSGAAPAGDARYTRSRDSPGAGRFSVPGRRSTRSHHGAAYGPRRRAHRCNPRLRGVQAAQLPDQQEQAEQPRSHHAAQVLQVVPVAHEPPGDPLAAVIG